MFFFHPDIRQHQSILPPFLERKRKRKKVCEETIAKFCGLAEHKEKKWLQKNWQEKLWKRFFNFILATELNLRASFFPSACIYGIRALFPSPVRLFSCARERERVNTPLHFPLSPWRYYENSPILLLRWGWLHCGAHLGAHTHNHSLDVFWRKKDGMKQQSIT